MQLLWWDGCPSTEPAVESLRRALADEGLDPDAVELLEVRTEDDAEREGFTGSPTIRVGDHEVAPATGAPPGLTCRIYRLRDGRVSPTPDPQDIRDTIRRATR